MEINFGKFILQCFKFLEPSFYLSTTHYISASSWRRTCFYFSWRSWHRIVVLTSLSSCCKLSTYSLKISGMRHHYVSFFNIINTADIIFNIVCEPPRLKKWWISILVPWNFCENNWSSCGAMMVWVSQRPQKLPPVKL